MTLIVTTTGWRHNESGKEVALPSVDWGKSAKYRLCERCKRGRRQDLFGNPGELTPMSRPKHDGGGPYVAK